MKMHSGWIAALVLTIFSQHSFAQAAGGSCEAVYSNATRNISLEARETIEMSSLFSQYCEANGSVRSGALGVSAKFPVEKVPVQLGINGSSASETHSRFCDVGARRSAFRSSSLDYANSVVVPALDLFNQCLAARDRGLILSHTILTPELFSISGELRDNHSRPVLTGLFHDRSTTCTSSSFGPQGGPAAKISFEKERPILRNFDIQCRREGVRRGSDIVYPLAAVEVQTNMGNYKVQLPEDSAYGPATASEAAARIQLRESTHAHEKQLLSQEIASLQAARNELERRLGSPVLRSMLLTVGERGGGFGEGITEHRNRVYCYADPNVEAQRYCSVTGGGRPMVQHIGTHGGHKCDYRYYILSCLTQ
jgi:hypothetical protein